MNVLKSKQFDDVYFSAEDGLAETHHVFLKGNGLPEAWQGQGAKKARFVIAETGFGTGLNFLAVWKLFEETASAGMGLDYFSFERFPLRTEEIRQALSFLLTSPRRAPGSIGIQNDPSMDPGLRRDDGYLDRLLSAYPPRIPGVHRIEMDERVTLTLIFDDVNAAMERLEAKVDCWFLDGFKPSSNPEMWSDKVFAQMARLSNDGATFATFTAAGFVKRGLRAAGFDVRKVRGFGRKRDMLTGTKL
jgi:tRNA 5-methylaminomethyl-2-thiouridine biosynthesis bifunctional protein